MSGDTANPRIWVGADVYVAALGSTAPVDVTTALNVAFVALGLLSEDSPTESLNDTQNDFYAHGGVYIRTVRSKFKREIKVVPLESNKTVWALTNPGSTVSTASGLTTRVIKTPVSAPQAMVWHMTDGTVTWRRVFTKVDLTGVGDASFSDSEISAPELTFTVFTDTSGVAYRDITNDPAAV